MADIGYSGTDLGRQGIVEGSWKAVRNYSVKAPKPLFWLTVTLIPCLWYKILEADAYRRIFGFPESIDSIKFSFLEAHLTHFVLELALFLVSATVHAGVALMYADLGGAGAGIGRLSIRRVFGSIKWIRAMNLFQSYYTYMSILNMASLYSLHYVSRKLLPDPRISQTSALLVCLLAFALAVAHVCVACFWKLASVVCVVERRKGMKACLKRSFSLLAGKRDWALFMFSIYLYSVGMIHHFYLFKLEPWSKKPRSYFMLLVQILLLLLLSAISFFSMFTQSVLFLVCKSSHSLRNHIH